MDDIFDMLESYMSSDDDDVYIADNSSVYTVDE